MVYLHIPPTYTEEEIMLQNKFQKLKKKKKALQVHKAPKQESEKPLIPKRPADAHDAREIARRLLKSGAIQALQKPHTKQDQLSFKRPKGQERKRNGSETLSQPYQPYSATQNDGFPSTDDTNETTVDRESNRVHNLYQQFATERDREERGFVEKKPVDATPSSTSLRSPTDKQQRIGNTIYVSGNKVTKEYFYKYFGQFGKIVNVNMEIEKMRGFITFHKPEFADRAIEEMDGKTVAGILLKVQLARRQPQIEPINDASSSAVWSTLAASHSQKGSHNDTRLLLEYDDTFS